MSFAGHVFDMINRMKYNESLKQSRRERYGKLKEKFYNELHIRNNPIREIYKSKKEIESIKKKIRQDIRKEKINTSVKVALAIFLLIVVYYLCV